MLNDKKVYSMNYGGKEVSIETGRLAKQADGAVLVSCEGTQVLVTACSATAVKDGQDFFPLLVEYTEKFYSAGKFVGGFLKREGRPSNEEVLNARLTDRPLRPLFPKGYMFDTVISCTVMSYKDGGDPEVLAGIGASAALSISDIPFAGPISFCKIGRINGEYVLNPAHSEWEKSDIEITLAASSDAILMVEGEAKLVPEKDILEALWFGQDHCKEMVALIAKMQKELGKTKREFVSTLVNSTMLDTIKNNFKTSFRDALNIVDKLDRQKAVAALENEVVAAMESDFTAYSLQESSNFKKEAAKGVDQALYDIMRADILDEEKRIGGRSLTQVRPIETEVSVLNTPHGSSLFTRGETQVLATVTLGNADGEKMSDRISGLTHNPFYLHYNFPPYSVGEARGVRGVGRREIGHGNLAERAVKAVMPSRDNFNYTTRIVCEVLESNGSSSMGSVCSASMALMDAGVKLAAPVAGIAMGLISDGQRFKILTDILGDEDHLGDMDFKVAGTADGISAIQMDIKITGLTRQIVESAMMQAKDGRLHILSKMEETISSTATMKENTPKMESLKINPDKIGVVIGPGGKNIKAMQARYELTLNCQEDGTVIFMGSDIDKINACKEHLNLIINGPEVGSDYDALVVTIKEYGAFVDIVDGVSGLIHVSEMSNERVNDPNEYVKEGDKIQVRVIEVDRMGRLKLSAKAVKPLTKLS